MRQRVERVEEVAKNVLSACIDKQQVRKGGSDYIISDIDLRTDVYTFLGELRLKLEKELKYNFSLIEENVTPSPDEIQEETVATPSGVDECGYFKRSDYNGSDDNYSVAVRMLGKLTMSGYRELRRDIIEKFKIPKDWIPSFKQLTANRPTVHGFAVSPTLNTCVTNPPPDKTGNQSASKFVQDLEDVGLFVEEGDINDNFLEKEGLVPKVTTANLALTAFVGQDMAMKDVMTNYKLAKDPGTVQMSRLDGTYATYVKHLTLQHEKKGFSPSNEKMVMIDSHDGAEHGKTNKDVTNIVSFSSKLVTKKSLAGGYGGGTSLDILTWQQMRGDKKPCNIFPAVNDYLLEKYEMIRNLPESEKKG